MTKDELIYELTRSFSETSGETDVFIEENSVTLKSLTVVEVDTINGKQRIVLS